jgi:hypothetical protein
MSTIVVDFSKFEARILLSSDRRSGVWASETLTKGKTRIRNAGQLPADASSHSLLVVALMAALRSISKRDATRLVEDADWVITKPRVLVVSRSADFGDALHGKVNGQNGKLLRAGKQFMRELARQVVRFDLTFDTDEENKPILNLRKWAQTSVPDPESVLSIFPIATSAVIH